jgi:hypothetical protein
VCSQVDSKVYWVRWRHSSFNRDGKAFRGLQHDTVTRDDRPFVWHTLSLSAAGSCNLGMGRGCTMLFRQKDRRIFNTSSLPGRHISCVSYQYVVDQPPTLSVLGRYNRRPRLVTEASGHDQFNLANIHAPRQLRNRNLETMLVSIWQSQSTSQKLPNKSCTSGSTLDAVCPFSASDLPFQSDIRGGGVLPVGVF